MVLASGRHRQLLSRQALRRQGERHVARHVVRDGYGRRFQHTRRGPIGEHLMLTASRSARLGQRCSSHSPALPTIWRGGPKPPRRNAPASRRHTERHLSLGQRVIGCKPFRSFASAPPRPTKSACGENRLPDVEVTRTDLACATAGLPSLSGGGLRQERGLPVLGRLGRPDGREPSSRRPCARMMPPAIDPAK